jgi:hypothetical protein
MDKENTLSIINISMKANGEAASLKEWALYTSMTRALI